MRLEKCKLKSFICNLQKAISIMEFFKAPSIVNFLKSDIKNGFFFEATSIMRFFKNVQCFEIFLKHCTRAYKALQVYARVYCIMPQYLNKSEIYN